MYNKLLDSSTPPLNALNNGGSIKITIKPQANNILPLKAELEQAYKRYNNAKILRQQKALLAKSQKETEK